MNLSWAASLAVALFPTTPLFAAEAPVLRIEGLVQHPQSFAIDALKAMPARHLDLAFNTMHGVNHHSWTGASLWEIVAKAGLRDESGVRTGKRHVLMISGHDGYGVAFAIGEIDPSLEGKQVIVAYCQDDVATDLPALRLIVPGDKDGARDVHDLASIEVR